MKFSKISTLAMLSASSLFSLSLNAKTLIIDDFLLHQDTNYMQFDLAHSQPSKRLTPYLSQFTAVSENFFNDGFQCLSLSLPSYKPQNMFDEFFKCKTGKYFYHLNEFEKRKYPENIKVEYVKEYEKHFQKYNEYINSIDRVEFRKAFTLFRSGRYDFDKNHYKYMSIPTSLFSFLDTHESYYNEKAYVGKHHDTVKAWDEGYNIRKYFTKYDINSIFKREDLQKSDLVFDMPVSVAEKLYEEESSGNPPLIFVNMVFEKEDSSCSVFSLNSSFSKCFRPVFEDFSFEIVSIVNENKYDNFSLMIRSLKDGYEVSDRIYYMLTDKNNPLDINRRNVIFKTNGVTVMDEEDKDGGVKLKYVYSLEDVND